VQEYYNAAPPWDKENSIKQPPSLPFFRITQRWKKQQDMSVQDFLLSVLDAVTPLSPPMFLQKSLKCRDQKMKLLSSLTLLPLCSQALVHPRNGM
jgi:hypothetical protein